MPNLYSFVSRKTIAPTTESVNAAELVSSVAEFVEIARKMGEYVFNDTDNNAKLIQSVMKTAKTVRVWSEKDENGRIFTRGETDLGNGNKIPFRCFGNKGEAVAEKETSDAAAIAKFVWGVCYQDGNLIAEVKHTNGLCKKFPVPYLRIA